MSSAGEIAIGVGVECFAAAVAMLVLYRLGAKFLPLPYRLVVPPFKVGVVLREGKPEKLVQTGSHWLMPKQTILTCDSRPTPFQLGPQECLTGDNMGLRISLTGEYHIKDPMAFVTASNNASGTFLLELGLALRAAVADLSGASSTGARDAIISKLLLTMKLRGVRFGMELDRIEFTECVPLGFLKMREAPEPEMAQEFRPN